MFHRRLMLLAGLCLAGAAPLVVQSHRLTVTRHEALYAEAESRLVRRNWMPCVRGSIVDRKGRVLAQDRPSYDIAVDYRVITGEWAGDMAASAAKREAGHTWLDLSPAERQERTDAWLAVFQEHLQSAWDLLAVRLGVSRARVDAERDRIIADVGAKYADIVRVRRLRETSAIKDRGEVVTPEREAAIEKQVNRPISEQTTAHTLFKKVSDTAAFDCRILAGEEADLASPLSERSLLTEGLAGVRGDFGGEMTAVTGVTGVIAARESGSGHSERVDRFPGLRVLDTGDREYPFESLTVQVDRSSLPGPLRDEGLTTVPVDGLMCHILGGVRDRVYGSARDGKTGRVTVGDADRRAAYLKANPEEKQRAYMVDDGGPGFDRGEYREGDRVGDTGVERAMEHALRGLRGVQIRQLDTEAQRIVAAEPGRDVKLTLDAILQARIQAAMEPELGLAQVQAWHGNLSATQPVGTRLFGAAVVLDIDSGDILAMVSTPTFTRRQVREDPASLYNTEKYPDLLVTTPAVNRAMDKAYQPGSIVKSILLAGAVSRGNFTVDQRIACTGHLLPSQPNAYRCWVYKQFQTTHNAVLGHDPDGSEAVMASCNIFFFTLGRRLGVEGVIDLYRRFGVGEVFDVWGSERNMGGGGPVFPGRLGQDRVGGGLTLGDAIQMGIGQGPVAWTPLHAANAYATLARGTGIAVGPRLIEGLARPDPVELGLDAGGVALAMRGLELAVRDPKGTGHHLTINGVQEPMFNAEGVLVWGKTGTAAASPVVTKDPDGEGPERGEILESGDHSWFVIMVGRDRPQYAIAVVMDFAGSGGKVSGPIANQIIHALIAEGYL